ncbi:hypothetical protein NQ318_019351 [Aromia moschata]|uniref:Uncharacterized protein n=1 Tax=Aromia moschata TaxID=1265417 RepID=A0AAV8YBI2_9CUCU|nr:hypothetical protein NQ318_019351 [Aromia moschata]
MQAVQELLEDDPDRRVEFCDLLILVLIKTKWIVFSDDATFTLNGHVNCQYFRYWAEENPHWMRELHTQRPQKTNVWAGIIQDIIVGPFFFDYTLNGARYLRVLQHELMPLKKYEQMHKNGRSAVKELVRDYKVIVDQRDSLLKDKEKLMKELSELRTLYHEELKKCDSVACIKNEKENRIAELVARQEEDKKVINDLKSKINEEISKYDNNMTQLEKLIRQLRKDKEHQEGSVKYLQNNIQKLHNDLNESRKNEKESKDLLNKCLLEKATLENERHQLERNYTAINQDKDKLVKEISYLNGLCEKVLSDFEASIKSSVEKEELFKNEINESKSMLLERGREIDRLNKIIQSKQVETEKILEQYATLKKNERELRDQLKLFENQTLESKELRSHNQVLEENLTKAEIEYNSCMCQLENAKKEVDSLQKQLRIVEDQREKDYSFYKTHVDELVRKNDELQVKNKKEFSEFKMNLNDMVQKLNNERSAYATLSEIHKDISAKYLKSIKDAVDERNARQEMEGKLRGAIRASEQLQSEKADLQQQIDVLLDGLNDGKSRINILTQEKDNAQKCSDDLQKRYNDLLTKCLSLENQLRTASLKTDSSTDTDGKEQIDRFKNEFEENHELILTLKDNIGKLQHHVTGLEFQKSEMTLRLHETQRKLETEQGLSEQLKNTHKLILAAILKMKDDGKVDTHDVRHLLHMVRNIDDDPTNDDLNECN